jgi:hypothetical protein
MLMFYYIGVDTGSRMNKPITHCNYFMAPNQALPAILLQNAGRKQRGKQRGFAIDAQQADPTSSGQAE